VQQPVKNNPMFGHPLIVKYFKKHRLVISFGVFSLVFVNLLVVLNPLVLKGAVDSITEQSLKHSLTTPPGQTTHHYSALYWGLLYLVLSALQAFFRYCWRVYLLTGALRTERSLRSDYVKKIMTFSLPTVRKHSPGQLMALASNDVESVRTVFDGGVIVFLDAGLFLLFAPIAMASLSPWLTLIAIAPLPLIPLIVHFSRNKVKKRHSEANSAFGKVMEWSRKSLTGIKQIRGAGREKEFLREFANEDKNFVKHSLELATLEAAITPALDLVMVISITSVIIFGGQMVMAGTITVGTFVAFQQYLTNLRWPATALGLALTIYQRGSASAKRIDNVLGSDVERSTGATLENTLSAALNNNVSIDSSVVSFSTGIGVEIKNLTFTYPDAKTPTLSNISLTIQPGQQVAILGEVGSGKTTLAHLLSSLVEAPADSLFFNGQESTSINLENIRSHIRYVPQNTYLFNTTLSNNLAVGFSINNLLNFNDQEKENAFVLATQKAALYNDITVMPLLFNTLIGERGTLLSGGQRQRMTIARALIDPGNLLILDDSLASVDISTERAILDALFQTPSSGHSLKKCTIVMITHRLSTAKKADTIFILLEGKLVATGTHEELIRTCPWYQEFAEQQSLQEELLSFAAKE
jgi:ATP-binding cassette, subfamily B, multidrug efflux pump